MSVEIGAGVRVKVKVHGKTKIRTKTKTEQKCTTKLVSGTVKFTAASIGRHRA